MIMTGVCGPAKAKTSSRRARGWAAAPAKSSHFGLLSSPWLFLFFSSGRHAYASRPLILLQASSRPHYREPVATATSLPSSHTLRSRLSPTCRAASLHWRDPLTRFDLLVVRHEQVIFASWKYAFDCHSPQLASAHATTDDSRTMPTGRLQLQDLHASAELPSSTSSRLRSRPALAKSFGRIAYYLYIEFARPSI